MPIDIECPRCGGRFRAKDALKDKQVACPKCKGTIVVAGAWVSALDVFISHSTKDVAIANAICHALEEKKIRCWIAPRDIPPGEKWAKAIVQGISQCRIMVVLLSEASVISQQVMNELEQAVSQDLRILPIKIKGVQLTSELSYFLNRTHWLDAFPDPIDQYLDQVVQNVRRLLSSDSQEPSVPPESVSLKPRQTGRSLARSLKLGALLAVLCVGIFSAWFLLNQAGWFTAEMADAGQNESDQNGAAKQEAAIENEPVVEGEPVAEGKPVTEVEAVAPWTLVDTFPGHNHRVSCLAFDENGERLVSGSLDGSVRVWDWSTGECLRQLSSDEIPYGTSADVYAVDVSALDSQVASGHGRVCRLWDIESGENIRSFIDTGSTFSAVAFSPDGSLLAMATSKGLQIMDMETRSKREAGDVQMFSVAFSVDGSQCATVGNETIFLWNVSSLDVPRRAINDPRRLACVAYRPDGKHVAAGGRAAVVVWNVTTGKAVHTLAGDNASDTFDAVAYSPQGFVLAAGGKGGVVRIWNSDTGEELEVLGIKVVGPGRYVHSLRFSPDGKKLAVGCGDGSIRIWATGL